MNGPASIVSPLATGNGAHVVHSLLSRSLPGYRVAGFRPVWSLVPPVLPLFSPVGRDVDVVHTTADYGTSFRSRRASLVVTLHNYVLDPFMREHSSFAQNVFYQTGLRRLYRRAIRAADVVTAVSEFTARLALDDLGLERDVEVIPNGVDEQTFSPRPKPDGPVRVLFSGNLTRRKGAQWLPAIADRLRDDVTVVYTKGLQTSGRLPEHPRLESVGSVPYERMPEVYNSAHLLLMPTVREGMPLAVLEAMACGLPVVASDCSSLPELVEEGQGGHLCPVGDVEAFADRVNALAADTGERERMGAFNRARILRDFTRDQMVARYARVLESVRSSP